MKVTTPQISQLQTLCSHSASFPLSVGATLIRGVTMQWTSIPSGGVEMLLVTFTSERYRTLFSLRHFLCHRNY